MYFGSDRSYKGGVGRRTSFYFIMQNEKKDKGKFSKSMTFTLQIAIAVVHSVQFTACRSGAAIDRTTKINKKCENFTSACQCHRPAASSR
jgi:hypothetical protein